VLLELGLIRFLIKGVVEKLLNCWCEGLAISPLRLKKASGRIEEFFKGTTFGNGAPTVAFSTTLLTEKKGWGVE